MADVLGYAGKRVIVTGCYSGMGEATARLLWTGGIIAFFAIQAVLWIVAITLTSQDPSHVVFEGYDQRALNWDSWQQSMRASAALGWQPRIEVATRADHLRRGG